ncbi:hypothetical protein JI76_01330 [Streptomyces anulatus]|uniref:transposase n=1 Tax=Streptomyces TaxID=1883 RepID=UPI0006DABA89|nr:MULTISPECIES: transposase [Streptomyces]KPL35653.1 hypothetical protein JI76_01330 [Streptomyces anulatus]MBT1103842.1 transposase [Streptomyces sp. Tu10]WTC67849.1 transposase [Streptomyces anulatus]WTC69042.1 transposase [Streptomyces anulatus]WUC91215.1 transposase [Streptomyces anulatus]
MLSGGTAFAEASRFRGEFYKCLTARRDELFELVDAMLCADGAVKTPVDLTLLPDHRRGHGAMYGGLNHGRIDADQLRMALAGLVLPRFDGGRLVPAVDVSPWLRSDAPCSADRLFCHVYGRAKTASQFIPGWPYSFVAVLEPGATSWTAILDAVRLGPVDDATAITADQLRGVVERLITAGQWKAGDPAIVIVSDAGYDVTRLAWVLRDLPVELVGRVRSDRVFAKQTLGWTTPKLRTPEAADRWTWLLIVAHTQLRLARPLAADLRRPWEKPTTSGRLTPARVRRGFRNIRAHLACPARVPKPQGAGPGRPPGAKNKHRAPRYDVGKTVKRPETLKAIGKPGRSW